MSAAPARKARRAIDGVLLLDKPGGMTSQTAVTRAKYLLSAAKAGHTGTLDPMATGLLPLAFGEATKFSHALLDADKAYEATVRLGVTTTTGDLEGAELTRTPVDVATERIEAALAAFRGEILQTPPMYSALKHAGKPLYEYARAGTEIAREARRVTIFSLALVGRDDVDVHDNVDCSKGTYIRVLAEDIGRALGCGATLAALRRTRVGRFSIEEAIGLDAFTDMAEPERLAVLRPVDALLDGLPSLALGPEEARRIALGQSIGCRSDVPSGPIRLYGPDAAFLGVADATSERLVPRRLLATAPRKA